MLAQLIAVGAFTVPVVEPEQPQPYTVPTPAYLKAMYPAFASVADATVQTWINRVAGVSGSGGDVDTSWFPGDYAPAIVAAAAHRMSRAGIGQANGSGMAASAGVDSFRSASVSIQFNSDAVKRASAGGWDSTSYGQDYAELLARNKSGPRVTGGGAIPCSPYGWAHGIIPPWMP